MNMDFEMFQQLLDEAKNSREQNVAARFYDRAVKTGEVKSPYPKLDVEACRRYAFAGIHTFSPRLFPYFEGWPDKFSVIDFYLSVCGKEPIYASPCPGLRMLDVGKLDSLAQAEEFLAGESCPCR